MRNACNTSLRRSERKKSLRRSGHRWEDNNEKNLQRTGKEFMDHDRSQWQAHVNMVMNIQFPKML
jgi:hypothetical protein